MRQTGMFWMAAAYVLSTVGAALAESSLPVVRHAELQAVTAEGTSTFSGSAPFVIRGILTSDPEEMLNPAWDAEASEANRVGGVFQVFFQGMGDDRGGTALYMAQNYNAQGAWIPAGNDYGAEWTNELARVTHDPESGRAFRKGDLVEVTARMSLFYNGKRNINENHRITVSNDFEVALLAPNIGLPPAEAVTVADLVNADGTAIFDATRETGGEHWQGMRVRLDGVKLVTTNGWDSTHAWGARVCDVVDAEGRPFRLRLPRQELPMPGTNTFFAAVGILNQEGGSTNGYELFVQEVGPVLNLSPCGGETDGVTLSFSGDFAGYTLQACDDLTGNVWTDVDATPRVRIELDDRAAPAGRNYRLRKGE